ncbi:hypothetical protein K450DRAFT_230892 [Umbelopsis ramanniana AG]|uniref:Uncharacterized protein n=1 Tax=Umbelopsis ramanniana AG TaxID=1314678 RepID=A0AAD5HG42_UMBRA|nr:uncharacterized protein K450DRAFT_230892 [Umbelopsis ramanniana AG]KAI8581729.1 hypothetical protein K450DRAFT_230892 [Umbelopsis ramanniana AG]
MSKVDMLQTTGWDLVRLLSPYVAGTSGSEELSLGIRSITLRIMDSIARHANPRELYLMILQTMSSISWDVDLDNLDSAVEGTVLFAVLNKMLSVVMARIKAKQLVRFMVTPIKAQWPVLTFIQGLLQAGYGDETLGSNKDIANTKKSWKEVLKVLVDVIYDFCDACVGMLSSGDILSASDSELKTEPQQRRYIVCYHILNVFDHILFVLPSNFARSYYMTRHKKYNVDSVRPGADKQSSIEIADSFGKDIIKRSMSIVAKSKFQMKEIVTVIAFNHNETFTCDDEESEDDDDTVRASNLPWPIDGVVAILATEVAVGNDEALSKATDIMPLGYSQLSLEDLLDDFGAYVVDSLNRNRGSLSYRLDKCLVILHDMLQRRGEDKLTLDDMQRTFGNLSGRQALEISAEECTWIGLFQVML